MLTEAERQAALAVLAQSERTVLDAVAGVTAEQARWKPFPERWSILEYVEHLAVSDDALTGLVRRILQTPPHTETAEERAAREEKIRTTKVERGVNQAPERLRPTGRFSTLDEAVAAFRAARARTLEYARTTTADLRLHFAPHPVFGPLDGYQWLVGNARHAELHAGHIRELRGMMPQ
jgi:hypothetical protein